MDELEESSRALVSRSSTVQARCGSPVGRISSADFGEREVVARPKANTPQPTQATPHKSHRLPCIYGKRQQRRFRGPIEDETTFLDIWPANAKAGASLLEDTLKMDDNTFAKPQLRAQIEDRIREQLAAINSDYPSFTRVNNFSGVINQDLLQGRLVAKDTADAVIQSKARMPSPSSNLFSPAALEEERRAAKQHSTGAEKPRAIVFGRRKPKSPERTKSSALAIRDRTPPPIVERGRSRSHTSGRTSPNTPSSSTAVQVSAHGEEDAFRIARYSVFREAAHQFAGEFKTYKPLLSWVLEEFDDYVAYCREYFMTPDDRVRFVEDAQCNAREEVVQEKANLLATLVDLKNVISKQSEEIAHLTQTSSAAQRYLEQYEAEKKERERMEAEFAETRVNLLSHINKVEKEVWLQRNALEGPEKRVRELEEEIKELRSKMDRANTVFEEMNRERSSNRQRIESLETTLREKRKAGRGDMGLSRHEIQAYKRREIELLEQNSLLMNRLSKTEAKLREMSELLSSRADPANTPRPQWADHDDVVPRAPTSAKRAAAAAVELRRVIAAQVTADEKYNELIATIGLLPREDPSLYSVPIHQIHDKYFFKLGYDPEVPGYLKGCGRVENKKLGLEATRCLLTRFWHERHNERRELQLAQSLTKFVLRAFPSDEASAYAYSLHHAMQWYGFDDYIGLSYSILSGDSDELLIHDMHAQADKLKEKVLQITEQRMNVGLGSNVSKTDVIAQVIEHFSSKEDDEIQRLVAALGKDFTGPSASAKTLFGVDPKKGEVSHFVEELRRQYFAERRVLLKEMTQCVILSINEEKQGIVMPQDVSANLWEMDPDIPTQYMDELMATIFAVSVETLGCVVDTESGVKHFGCNGERKYTCDDTVANESQYVIPRMRGVVLRRFCKRSAVDAALERRAKFKQQRLAMKLRQSTMSMSRKRTFWSGESMNESGAAQEGAEHEANRRMSNIPVVEEEDVPSTVNSPQHPPDPAEGGDGHAAPAP